MTTTKPIIRRWKVLTDGRTASELDLASIRPGAEWKSAYSLVQGELPAVEFSDERSAFVRGAVNVTKTGNVKLKLNSTDGVRLWVDDEVQDLSSDIGLALGRREFTFLIDIQKRNDDGLRVELVDDQANRARYQIGNGE